MAVAGRSVSKCSMFIEPEAPAERFRGSHEHSWLENAYALVSGAMLIAKGLMSIKESGIVTSGVAGSARRLGRAPAVAAFTAGTCAEIDSLPLVRHNSFWRRQKPALRLQKRRGWIVGQLHRHPV